MHFATTFYTAATILAIAEASPAGGLASVQAFPYCNGLMPDSRDDCFSYHLVGQNDTCASVISDGNLNGEDFYAWNPKVGVSNCSNLWLNYLVCVGLKH